MSEIPQSIRSISEAGLRNTASAYGLGPEATAGAPGGPGEAVPYGAEPPIGTGLIAPDAGPSRKQVAWEGTKKTAKLLKDTFWSKEEMRLSLLTSGGIAAARLGLGLATGGLSEVETAMVGAGIGAGRAGFMETHRVYKKQREELEGRADLTPEEQVRLDKLRGNVLEKFRGLQDKRKIAGKMVTAGVLGALGGELGLKLKEWGVAGIIAEFAREHITATLGTLGGAGIRLWNRYQDSKNGGEAFFSRKTTINTVVGGLIGGVLGTGWEFIGPPSVGFIKSGLGGAATAVKEATAVPTATIPQVEAPKPAVLPGTPGPVESPVASPASSPAVRPAVSPAASPEASSTATPTSTSTVTPEATRTPTSSPTATSTPTRVPPTSTPTPGRIRVSEVLPGGEKPFAVADVQQGLVDASLASNRIIPIGLTSSIMPESQSDGIPSAAFLAQAALPAQSPDVDASKLTEKLTLLRHANVQARIDAEGAKNYADALKLGAIGDNGNPITQADIDAAQKDALFKSYEEVIAAKQLAEVAKRLASDASNIAAAKNLVDLEKIQHEGAQNYAKELEKVVNDKNDIDKLNPFNKNLPSVTKPGVDAAYADATLQANQTIDPIKNLTVLENTANDVNAYMPTSDELKPPEVRLGLPNFFSQQVTVEPRSSFWQSFKIPNEYFANGEEHGWVNPENGVTQEDVIKDMLRKFAIANGHPIDRIGVGTVNLEDLDLTEEQEFAIRKALSTRTAGQYINEGAMSTFQAALKKVA